jgi:hypothetical protein
MPPHAATEVDGVTARSSDTPRHRVGAARSARGVRWFAARAVARSSTGPAGRSGPRGAAWAVRASAPTPGRPRGAVHPVNRHGGSSDAWLERGMGRRTGDAMAVSAADASTPVPP